MSIVDPNGALTGTDGCQERSAVGCKRNSLFFGCAGRSHLLRSTFGKALAPYVESTTCVGGEIHPLPIGGPCRVRASGRRRSHPMTRGTAVKRHHSARHPI